MRPLVAMWRDETGPRAWNVAGHKEAGSRTNHLWNVADNSRILMIASGRRDRYAVSIGNGEPHQVLKFCVAVIVERAIKLLVIDLNVPTNQQVGVLAPFLPLDQATIS